MKIAIIGRSEIMYNVAIMLRNLGHEIVCILTAKEAVEYTITAEDFHDLSIKWGIPFAQGTPIIKHKVFLQNVRADIGVSLNYTGVIPQSIIDLFPNGVLNAHGGDLPRYRGNACQAWAIINGENKIGLCIHKMIGGELDSGDIIDRDYLEIDQNTKVTSIWEWMGERIPHLFLNAIQKLLNDSDYVMEKQSNNPQDAIRCYPRRPEDGRINWIKSSIEVLRLINASNKPYTGAFCSFEDEKLVIWSAEIEDDKEIFYAVPGQITKLGDGFMVVACGKGKLKVTLVEYKEEVTRPNNIIKSIRKRLL